MEDALLFRKVLLAVVCSFEHHVCSFLLVDRPQERASETWNAKGGQPFTMLGCRLQ